MINWSVQEKCTSIIKLLKNMSRKLIHNYQKMFKSPRIKLEIYLQLKVNKILLMAQLFEQHNLEIWSNGQLLTTGKNN